MADEQNTNPGQQPETEQQKNMAKVKNFTETMKGLGLDVNLMFDIFGGIAENAIKKSEQTLSGLIEMKVKNLGDNLAGQIKANNDTLAGQIGPVIAFVKDVQGQMAQAQGQQQPGTSMIASGGNEIPPGPGLGGGMGGAMNNIAGIVPILKMLGLVPGGGDQGGSGGLAQMATLAKSWGDVMRAMMEPVVEMQTTMRQSLLQEMQTYSRTGGNLPWDREDEPDGGRTARLTSPRHREPPGRVILNQPVDDSPSDYSKEAAELAKRFKFA